MRQSQFTEKNDNYQPNPTDMCNIMQTQYNNDKQSTAESHMKMKRLYEDILPDVQEEPKGFFPYIESTP